MLGGIKTGKRKKSRKHQKEDRPSQKVEGEETILGGRPSAATARSSSRNENESVAEQLRRSFASTSSSPCAVSGSGGGGKDPPHNEQRLVLLETSSCSARLPSSSSRDALDPTIDEMVAQERFQKMSSSEQVARNIARTGKKRRLKQSGLAAVDSDEEEARQLQYFKEGDDSRKVAQRDLHRRIARHDRQDAIVSKCWWWIESSRFANHRLLAIGDSVSLVMAPPNLSLKAGHHFYLVPIQHASSLATCDDDVWDELVRFQSGLCALYREEKRGVLFCETVLPNSGFWQTRMEVIPVPDKIWQDAPLYFRSALSERAEEWGTHQRLMKTGLTAGKTLRRTVPAAAGSNFSYFYLEYDHLRDRSGYAQMIESSDFPKDFAADTIAGMLRQDPLRLRRKDGVFSAEDENRGIAWFLDKWKPYDWTRSLPKRK